MQRRPFNVGRCEKICSGSEQKARASDISKLDNISEIALDPSKEEGTAEKD